jgi:hypothetical protein
MLYSQVKELLLYKNATGALSGRKSEPCRLVARLSFAMDNFLLKRSFLLLGRGFETPRGREARIVSFLSLLWPEPGQPLGERLRTQFKFD